MNRPLLACVCGVAAISTSAALAQWSSDPMSNLRLADRVGEQVQPKLAPTPDGGAYISWFDNGVAHHKSDTWTWSGTAWTKAAITGPSARYLHAMAYDGAHQRTVLFGGADASNTFADTWEWNGTSWTQRVISGPSGRSATAMAYDGAHGGAIVLFGGVDGLGSVDGDTWLYDGTTWTAMSPATSPPARKGHAMAFDTARNVVVLFGGTNGAGATLSDTWEWTGSTWTQASPALSPQARSGHGMAFDPGSGQIIVFGGQDGGVARQDTWLYNGTNWTNATPAPPAISPFARYNCAMAQDFTAAGARVVVYGGFSGTGNVGNMFEWSGTTWTSKATTPNARNGPAMAYHIANNTTVMFGGLDSGGYDVFVQKVSAAGVEQWAHNGVEIADRVVSSTIDYSMASDSSGNAVIVFNDDRPLTAQITLQKITPAGALAFGAAGINVGPGSTTGSQASVAALADGNYGVAWTSTASPVTTLIQKVDGSTGVLLLNGGAPMTQADWLTPARPVQVSDVQPDNAGGMIVLFIRCTGTNCATSNKQLYVQRYNGLGQPLWNSGVPIDLMLTTASIQTGYFPKFLPDGAGGAVIGWYENTTNARHAYIQHVLAAGTKKFASPLNSVGPAAPTTRIRVGAGASYDLASGAYYLAAPETDNATQAVNSVMVQKFDSSGNRLWGDTGVTVLAQTTATQPSFVQSQALGGDALVFFMETRTATTRVISAARATDSGGTPVASWYFQPNSDSSNDKSRLTSTMSACGGFAILAYGYGNTGGVDIGVTNVNPEGSIGPGGACPIFTTQPPATSRPCAGGTLSLTAAAGNAPCYQWKKGGVALSNSARVTGANSGSLTITGVQPSDAGTYTLVASNTCGDVSSSATIVTICAADYNSDGSLGVNDIFDFLAGWFAGNARADYNSDGGLSVQDIFDFLAAWFAGC